MSLLSELSALLRTLSDDLDERVRRDPDELAALRAAHAEQKERGRTGESFSGWRKQYTEQVAVHWVITLVFVRYLEDNGFLPGRWLAGDGAEERREARERYERYFEDHPTHGDDDYLLHLLSELAAWPAGAIFGPDENRLHQLVISADAAKQARDLFAARDDEGRLRWRFDAPDGDTRVLGDLYQDLSEGARKRYALLQTPDFIEDFLLRLSLDPAMERFGHDTVRVIDPTCGSGHLLLGAFDRLLAAKRRARPGADTKALVAECLEQVAGVDLNPFAAAIARFRLLVASLRALGNGGAPVRLDRAPSFSFQVAAGDSLILGKRFAQVELDLDEDSLGRRHGLRTERHNTDDRQLAERLLSRRYHVVVGNPPYITVKDRGLRDTYRDLYRSCHGKYSLVCPFYERFFNLAKPGGTTGQRDLLGDSEPDPQDDPHHAMLDEETSRQRAGFVAMIVSNAFAKREYGKKLVEEVIPNTDLTRVIDTSGAYIPGHGTPTLILTGRARTPRAKNLRAVLGIRGEPSQPEDPAQGRVWSSIRDQIDQVGFQNAFISVEEVERDMFGSHPWTLRGGGALAALNSVVTTSEQNIGDIAEAMGFDAIMGQDELFVMGDATLARVAGSASERREFVEGASVRDYALISCTYALFPYDENLEASPPIPDSKEHKHLWRFRTSLINRMQFGKTTVEAGLEWFEYRSFYKAKRYTPLSITFAEVATHNHFVLDRGGKVFNRTAPIIKLPEDATEDDHLALLGPLNSSVGDFWAKMTFFSKGGPGGGNTKDEKWNDFYQRNSTKVEIFPLPATRPIELARRLDTLGAKWAALRPSAIARDQVPSPAVLDEAREKATAIRGRMIALQEELDWRCYELYGLLDDGDAPLADDLDALPEVALGERAFEIVLARQVRDGEIETQWFARHGSEPTTEVPARWPSWYRALVERRIALIDERRAIRLIEDPEFKRRWNDDAWSDEEREALEEWLLARLESPAYVPQADRDDAGAAREAATLSLRELATRVRGDETWLEVAQRYKGGSFDIDRLVRDLVVGSAVPALPRERYKKRGRAKRREWEEVWRKQRVEDAALARADLPPDHPDRLSPAAARQLAADEVGAIEKPPKYNKSDFAKGRYYDLRGKLDVPKERWVLYSGLDAEGDAGALVAWAGLDHRQRAEALSRRYFERIKPSADTERALTALAAMLDLRPWLLQWHNTPEPGAASGFGDAWSALVEGEVAHWGLSLEAVEARRLGEE